MKWFFKRKSKWCHNRLYRQKTPMGYQFKCHPISQDCKLWIARVHQYPLLTIKFAATTPNAILITRIDQLICDYQNHELISMMTTIKLTH